MNFSEKYNLLLCSTSNPFSGSKSIFPPGTQNLSLSEGILLVIEMLNAVFQRSSFKKVCSIPKEG